MFKKGSLVIRVKRFVQSFGVSLLSVALVNVFITAVYQSDDDIFYLYTLSGSFGEPPSSLLNVNHIWHPVLSTLVKGAFTLAPSVNWYTIFLLCFHVIGLSCFFYYLRQRFSFLRSLFIYAVAFSFFEIRLLQSLDFTGSAMWAALGACLLLKVALAQKSARAFWLSAAIFLTASLLRFHIVYLVLVLMMPILVSLHYGVLKKLALWGTCVAGGWLVLHLVQVKIYEKQIPGWQAAETFRSAFFYMANRPGKSEAERKKYFTASTDEALFNAGFFYDSALISIAQFQAISKKLTRRRSLGVLIDRQMLYWMFIENRVYLFLFALLFLVFASTATIRFKNLLVYLLPAGLWLYLFFFLKITLVIHLCLLAAIFIYYISFSSYHQALYSKHLNPYLALLFLLPLLWVFKIIGKANSYNKARHQQFYCIVRELQNASSLVFIATDYNFALNYISIWDTPSAYKINNVIYYQKLITDTYKNTLNRQGVPLSFPAMLLHPHVRLMGQKLPALETYLQQRYHKAVTLSSKDTSFRCIDVYRLDADENL